MASVLPYDPGILPTKPSPLPGEHLQLELDGLPPIKDRNKSIRNRTHPLHGRFLALRRAATTAMADRAWVFGRVRLQLVVRSAEHEDHYGLNDYLGGVMDTLDGSSGRTFTFLPIVYEDDCQVWGSETRWEESSKTNYSLRVLFQ